MAQRPTADFNIDPNVTSGTDLANILNRFQDAIDSGNSGASRPAYLDAGGLWVREGDPMRLYLYDGTTDRELYNTTDGLVGASQWKDNGDDIYYDEGNVGIGTDAPETTLDVNGTFRYGSSGIDASDADAANRPGFYAMEDALSATNYPPHFLNGCASLVTIAGYNVNNWTQLAFAQNSPFAPAFRSKRAGDIGGWREFVVTDDNGNVGIGMDPLRQASEAKEQLEDWKSAIEERMKAEPKADRSAVTQEITGFEELPTLEQVKERLERAAGDKLQVAGNISASGTVDAAGFTVNGSPLTRVSDLIETFRTLKNAVSDETTVEGIKEALTNSLGGLIEQFESMQSAATQEIES